MLVVVTLISALVHIYSIGYMSHDLLNLDLCHICHFTFSMLALVVSDNFLQYFLAGKVWDFVHIY